MDFVVKMMILMQISRPIDDLWDVYIFSFHMGLASLADLGAGLRPTTTLQSSLSILITVRDAFSLLFVYTCQRLIDLSLLAGRRLLRHFLHHGSGLLDHSKPRYLEQSLHFAHAEHEFVVQAPAVPRRYA